MSSIDQIAGAPSVIPAPEVQPASTADIHAAFSVGGVFTKTASVFMRYFWPFTLITAAIMLPYLILLLVNHDYAASQYDGPSGHGRRPAGGIAGLNLVVVILQVLAQGAVLKAAFLDLSGQPIGIAAAGRLAFLRSRLLVGIAVMDSVGVALGAILLIVPGLIIYAMWYVASAVCMNEDLGAMESLRRSTVLTRGSRWKVLGVALTQAFAVIAIQLVLNTVIPAAVGITLWAMLDYGFQVISLPLTAVLVAVVYHDLRNAKEGLRVARIAAVFD